MMLMVLHRHQSSPSHIFKNATTYHVDKLMEETSSKNYWVSFVEKTYGVVGFTKSTSLHYNHSHGQMPTSFVSLLVFSVSFSPNRCSSTLTLTFCSTCITYNVYFVNNFYTRTKTWKLITIVIGP